MPYALELGLDDHAAAVVRRLWHDLEDEGIVHMARSQARPHVSVGIWDSLDRDAAEAELTRFATEVAPLPTRWVPHCTLATDVTAEQFTRALEVARRVALPIACRLVEIGIVEFGPVKQLISRPLGRP